MTLRILINFAMDEYRRSDGRPLIEHNPVGALMFQFKSFPLFIIEAAALMYKQSPKSAVYMLLGLTAMTGIQGLPFAETIEDLIDTIGQAIGYNTNASGSRDGEGCFEKPRSRAAVKCFIRILR